MHLEYVFSLLCIFNAYQYILCWNSYFVFSFLDSFEETSGLWISVHITEVHPRCPSCCSQEKVSSTRKRDGRVSSPFFLAFISLAATMCTSVLHIFNPEISHTDSKGKGKVITNRPCRPWGVQESQGSQFSWHRHCNGGRLSAVCTGRLYPQEHSWWQETLLVPQGHSATSRIMSWRKILTPSGIEPATCRFVA